MYFITTREKQQTVNIPKSFKSKNSSNTTQRHYQLPVVNVDYNEKIKRAEREGALCQTPSKRRTDGRTDSLSVSPSLRWSLTLCRIILLLLLILGTASTRRVSSFACRCHTHRNTVVTNSKVFSLSLKSTLGMIMHWKNIFLVFEIFLTASVLSAYNRRPDC